jgi:prepilin-type N-terminal cleavage/methylation domain-containing protein
MTNSILGTRTRAAGTARPAPGGFTLIEILIVVGIMGMMMAVSYPSILNTMQTRNLENTTRRVQTYLQLTKLRAVSTKITHRVRFTRIDESYWAIEMERAQVDGTWVKAEGAPRKTIPNNLNVTVDLPVDGSDPIIVFSPLGTVANFTTGQNSITLQNPKLARPGQMDERVISLYMGGSIQYDKRKSS